MPMAQALRLCPDLITLSGDHKTYRQYSHKVMEILRTFSSVLEQISIDEAFLDITDVNQKPEHVAIQLHNKILIELGLPNSIGLAGNKLVAKIATEVAKATSKNTDKPPNAIMIVPPGEEEDFLAPLKVDFLWGVGPKTSAKLAELGIKTIADLAKMPETTLIKLFGSVGYELWLRSHGIDNRPVIQEHAIKFISREITFANDIYERKPLEEIIYSLARQVSDRLSQKNLEGTTIKLKLRWADFSTLSRQKTLPHSTDQCEIIFSTACELFYQIWKQNKPVRLLGVGISGLTPRQLTLWEDNTHSSQSLSDEKINVVFDSLRKKYGEKAVFWGKELDNQYTQLE